ncbi:MAG TPA: OsmC family protein [Thermoanaerobaculia bacterium]|nr:OsmC family protein [Thermoanaerobaculia bacterium]
MPVRKAEAEWRGGLRDGKGSIKAESGALNGQYSFGTRFENGTGTNPEELIAAAHAGCFSMALSAALEKAGHPAKRVHTTAAVRLDKVGDGFGITKIDLTCEAEVPGVDNAAFQETAKGAKQNCPVSKALSAVEITLSARLL